MVALDAKTGKVAWEAARGTDGYVANISGPIIANGILFRKTIPDRSAGIFYVHHLHNWSLLAFSTDVKNPEAITGWQSLTMRGRA